MSLYRYLSTDVNGGTADLEEIVSRLQSSLPEPIVIERNVLRSSATFGWAMYPHDGTTRDTLFDVADHAVYSSKMATGISA